MSVAAETIAPAAAPGPRAPRALPLSNPAILRRALRDAAGKLRPAAMARNPVMFVVETGAALLTALWVFNLWRGAPGGGFTFQITLWLWFTAYFAAFAEAIAEARGKAQADSLRRAKTEIVANRLANGREERVAGVDLRVGDLVVCRVGDTIPGDGEVAEGIATVDESMITGESAPVIRESGGDRSAVTGGTRVLSDEIKVRILRNPGETFLDRMIALVEGAKRRKTPNEIALDILIAGLTIIFLLAVATLPPFALYAIHADGGAGRPPSVVVLTALLVCLIPTTIGGLLSAIGIAGMDRVLRHNILAMSGKAVEAAGDIDTLLLDKTGTITLGNRRAVAFLPAAGVSEEELAEAAQLASLADETPEGRSIVVLAKERCGLRGRELPPEASFIPFSAHTRMSGVDLGARRLRKGATEAVAEFVRRRSGAAEGRSGPAMEAAREAAMERVMESGRQIARTGGTPLAVADGGRFLGVIHLKDVVKGGMKPKLEQLRAMGIRSVMITGDNPLTAAAIAAEAGTDEFLAQATPEDKLAYLRREQSAGRLVAMTGDGANDAPALAQADVGTAMNTGSMAAKEAGNMVDLDSNPTKLLEVVAIGKQLLITRGALTTFSIANDVAKYFAIIPALFAGIYPALGALNIMRLATPQLAVLAAVVFNALIIVALIPLALRGVRYKPSGAAALLRRNLLLYGVGGVIAPFPGIWVIAQALHWLRCA